MQHPCPRLLQEFAYRLGRALNRLTYWIRCRAPDLNKALSELPDPFRCPSYVPSYYCLPPCRPARPTDLDDIPPVPSYYWPPLRRPASPTDIDDIPPVPGVAPLEVAKLRSAALSDAVQTAVHEAPRIESCSASCRSATASGSSTTNSSRTCIDSAISTQLTENCGCIKAAKRLLCYYHQYPIQNDQQDGLNCHHCGAAIHGRYTKTISGDVYHLRFDDCQRVLREAAASQWKNPCQPTSTPSTRSINRHSY